MKKEFRVGLVGYGRIGKIHLKNLIRQNGVGKIAVCDPKEINLPYQDIPTFTTLKNMLDQFHPDILFICSPTPTHVALIQVCCKMGIHVFCEKPIDLDLEKIQKLAIDTKKSGIALHVGFNRRFDPDFARLKQKIDSGQIGQIHQITITSRDPGLPSMDYISTSGGMISDMTIHDIDMALYLTGATIKEVYSKGQIRIEPELKAYNDIDTATSVLTFDNQTTCTIINSRQTVYGYDQRIEVFGSQGMISVGNQLIDRLSISGPEGQQFSPPEPFFLERYAASYRVETDDFITRLQLDQSPSVTLKDAIRASEIALMINESIQNQRVVSR